MQLQCGPWRRLYGPSAVFRKLVRKKKSLQLSDLLWIQAEGSLSEPADSLSKMLLAHHEFHGSIAVLNKVQFKTLIRRGAVNPSESRRAIHRSRTSG